MTVTRERRRAATCRTGNRLRAPVSASERRETDFALGKG
jgi:hypothetical protein